MKFKCPYCGTENSYKANDICGMVVIYCDCEIGGCDKPFVMEYKVIKTYEIVTKKIEGIEGQET